MSGGFDIMDTNNGFFTMKFDLPIHKERATIEVFCMLFNHSSL